MLRILLSGPKWNWGKKPAFQDCHIGDCTLTDSSIIVVHSFLSKYVQPSSCHANITPVRCPMESRVLSVAFWTLTTTSCSNVWHRKSYIYHTYHSRFKLVNSYDSQLKTRKKLRIICQNFRKLNLDPNRKHLWNLLLHLAYLKIIVEILKFSDLGWCTPFPFKKTIILITWVVGILYNNGSMKVWENLMSTYPLTLVGPMETSWLQTSLVWNWKRKLGRQNFN
jgi:hypothetical protein